MKKLIGIWTAAMFVLGSLGAVQAYEEVEVPDGGVVKGVVKLNGTAPEVKMLPITKDNDYCGSTTPDPQYVISANKEIQNVVVTIEGIEKGKKLVAVEGAVLDNAKCVFTPHVQAVTKGTKLTVVNSDPIMHNTHAYLDGKATVFNLALPLKDQEIFKPLKRPGMLSAVCDAGHTWMSAYVYVSDHPYYAVTDAVGAFEISDVPPGTYKVMAWHESLGTVEQEVTVPAKGVATSDFAFASK